MTKQLRPKTLTAAEAREIASLAQQAKRDKETQEEDAAGLSQLVGGRIQIAAEGGGDNAGFGSHELLPAHIRILKKCGYGVADNRHEYDGGPDCVVTW